MTPEDSLDVATLLARIEQIDREQQPEHWLWDRVMSCDVPRLRRALMRRHRASLDRVFQEHFATLPAGIGAADWSDQPE